MLNPAFRKTGIAYCKYSNADGMLVVMFAGDITEKGSSGSNSRPNTRPTRPENDPFTRPNRPITFPTRPVRPTPSPAPRQGQRPTAPVITRRPDNQSCVREKSVPQCGKCQSKDQCQSGYCCPWMKKCVQKGQDECYVEVARCVDFCYDSANQEKCNCENQDYPQNWVGRTCQTGKKALPRRPYI